MILHPTKAGVKEVTNECNAVRHGMEVNDDTLNMAVPAYLSGTGEGQTLKR